MKTTHNKTKLTPCTINQKEQINDRIESGS